MVKMIFTSVVGPALVLDLVRRELKLFVFYQKMAGSLAIVGSTKRPMRLGQLTKSYSCPVFHDLSMFEIQPWVKSSSCHCQTLVVVISPSSGKSHFRENQ